MDRTSADLPGHWAHRDVAIIDLGSIVEALDRVWAQHAQAAVVGTSIALAAVLATITWRFAHSTRKDRWIDRMAAALVLAWTSEGMWEVATQKLRLPAIFAIATFFVVEAMLLSSALRAGQHRKAKGVPGPSGTLVWVLAAVFGAVVALAAGTLVEFLLRIALPLAAVGLWWTGLTAERPDDTAEMKAERQRRAEERDATWAFTPRTLLVRWGVLKPGRTTTTQAQREHQVRRMVVLAHKATTGPRHLRAWRLSRLRALTRTADEPMVAEVAARVDRARRAEELMVLPVATLAQAVAINGRTATDSFFERGGRPASRPDGELDSSPDNSPDTPAMEAEAAPDNPDTRTVRPATAAGGRTAWSRTPRRRKPTSLDRARPVLDRWSQEGRELTGEALAAEIGDMSDRTGRRVIEKWKNERPAGILAPSPSPDADPDRPPTTDSRTGDRSLTSVG